MGKPGCSHKPCLACEYDLLHDGTDVSQGETKTRVPEVGDYVRITALDGRPVKKVISMDPPREMFQTNGHDGWYMDNRYSSWEFVDHEPENRDLPQVESKARVPKVGDCIRPKALPWGSAKKIISINATGDMFRAEDGGEFCMDNRFGSWEFTHNPYEYLESRIDQAKTASKHDGEKPPMDLLDRTWMEETARVLGFGSKKYSPNNWRRGLAQSRLIAAALRHITAYNDGEDLDPESGLSHIAHASCCLMFLQNGIKEHPELDDRHKK